jgi:hypothetical protein
MALVGENVFLMLRMPEVEFEAGGPAPGMGALVVDWAPGLAEEAIRLIDRTIAAFQFFVGSAEEVGAACGVIPFLNRVYEQ